MGVAGEILLVNDQLADQGFVPRIDPDLPLNVVPVEGQVMALRPPHLVQAHLQGVFDPFFHLGAGVGPGQVGEGHLQGVFPVGLVQGRID